MKQKIVHLVEQGDHGYKLNKYFDYGILFLIALNVVAIILETVPSIYAPHARQFRIFDVISVIIFSIEYLLRVYVSDITHPSSSRIRSAGKFALSGYGIIDILAIIPFYLPFFFPIDLRILRLLRFMRFARLFKIARYNKSLNILWHVIKSKKVEFGIIGIAALIILVISSTLIYYAEGSEQPDQFPSIAASLYWAVSTVTSLGYGDVYPVTNLGKLLASVVSILGIGLVAVPTGLISSGFFEMRRTNRKNCPHCGEPLENH
ncbi:MAG: ion transporter [Bacteroidia bacterium]